MDTNSKETREIYATMFDQLAAEIREGSTEMINLTQSRNFFRRFDPNGMVSFQATGKSTINMQIQREPGQWTVPLPTDADSIKYVKAIDDIKYEELDIGIRNLVRLLRSKGFETTDSGDGKSKFENNTACCAEPVSNVYIEVNATRMVAESHRLMEVIRDNTIEGTLESTIRNEELEMDVPRVLIEASYSPIEGTAILMIHGLLDSDLRTEYGIQLLHVPAPQV